MLTNEEIKTFFNIKKIAKQDSATLRWEADPEADYRYGCHGVYRREDIVPDLTYALRMPEYDIFSTGDIGVGRLSWSSRSGFCMFNLTPEAEDKIRQIVHEYNAEKKLKDSE